MLLWVVSAFCSSVMAAGHVELRIAPEDVNLGGYQASDTITIQIYATGFYENYPWDTIGTMNIAAVLTDSNGTASAPSLHSALAYGTGGSSSPGDVINAGGVLIEDIRGYIIIGDIVGVYPFPAVLWECEFHIPDAPLSSIITISLDGLSLKNLGSNDLVPAYTVGEPLEIHMACCPGDCEPVDVGDEDMDIYDYNKLRGQLRKAYKATGAYYISPTDPCEDIRVLWKPALDCEPWGVGDVDVDIYDYNKLRGQLRKAYKATGAYYISPTDPCEAVRALWPCN